MLMRVSVIRNDPAKVFSETSSGLKLVPICCGLGHREDGGPKLIHTGVSDQFWRNIYFTAHWACADK